VLHRPIPQLTPSEAACFWSRCERGPMTRCWCWKSRMRRAKGYGAFGLRGTTYSAHRIAYLLEKGTDPAGHCVCHSCDTPGCCNPSHLFVGTVADNNRDKALKGRAFSSPGESHPNAKLTAEVVRVIRASCEPQSALAERYGTTQANVSLIQNRKAWRHIP
jgi:hypothetical protein